MKLPFHYKNRCFTKRIGGSFQPLRCSDPPPRHPKKSTNPKVRICGFYEKFGTIRMRNGNLSLIIFITHLRAQNHGFRSQEIIPKHLGQLANLKLCLLVASLLNEFFKGVGRRLTPPRFNIDPQKWWLEDDPFLLGFGNFWGVNSLLVFGGELSLHPKWRKPTIMASQPTPPYRTPPRNKGLIAGLIKGNQRLISPDHKALSISGAGYVARGGLVDQPSNYLGATATLKSSAWRPWAWMRWWALPIKPCRPSGETGAHSQWGNTWRPTPKPVTTSPERCVFFVLKKMSRKTLGVQSTKQSGWSLGWSM